MEADKRLITTQVYKGKPIRRDFLIKDQPGLDAAWIELKDPTIGPTTTGIEMDGFTLSCLLSELSVHEFPGGTRVTKQWTLASHPSIVLRKELVGGGGWKALADGTTSLYISNGGGMIGGQAHEAVRNANAAFSNHANRSLQDFIRCEAFPLAEAGHTTFYVLTGSGVVTEAAPEHDLGYGRHPLSTLFHAGQEVISQLRLISEAADNDA